MPIHARLLPVRVRIWRQPRPQQDRAGLPGGIFSSPGLWGLHLPGAKTPFFSPTSSSSTTQLGPPIPGSKPPGGGWQLPDKAIQDEVAAGAGELEKVVAGIAGRSREQQCEGRGACVHVCVRVCCACVCACVRACCACVHVCACVCCVCVCDHSTAHARALCKYAFRFPSPPGSPPCVAWRKLSVHACRHSHPNALTDSPSTHTLLPTSHAPPAGKPLCPPEAVPSCPMHGARPARRMAGKRRLLAVVCRVQGRGQEGIRRGDKKLQYLD